MGRGRDPPEVTLEQRLRGDTDARGDSAAQVIALVAHRVEHRSGTEVDDDQGGRPVQFQRRNDVDDAVVLAGRDAVEDGAVEAATGKRSHVGVYGTDFATPDGTGVRDYIHVSDLAAAHVAALDLLGAEPAKSHTLNAGYGTGFSVLEVLGAVDKVTNMTIGRRLEGRRAGDPAMLISDNSAILATLDWQPRHADLDGIVRDALAWERTLAERQR